MSANRPDLLDSLAAIGSAFDDVPQSVALAKVAEELGEASAAYIGAGGYNPRKGRTHLPQDVAVELVDVAIAAVTAMQAFDPQWRLALRQRVAEVLARSQALAP